MITVSRPIINSAEINSVVNVLKSGFIAQGPKVEELEKSFSKYCSVKHAIAFNSGTAAIHAGLKAMGIEAGDEVITTPFTFVATANPILMQGAKIVFADISKEDYNLDPNQVTRKITSRTKAIIPVNLYGQIHDYKAMKSLTRGTKIKILEDACQSIGASQDNKMSGTCGDVAAFSLYATKNIMCGEGGMLTTNNSRYAEAARRFRHHGQSEKTRYQYYDLGYNYRLTDMAAAIAVEQLKKLDRLNAKRISNANKLSKGLSDIEGLILPKVNPGNKHVFHQFTVRVTKNFGISRDNLIEAMKLGGVGCGIYYPKPLHMHPHFRKLGYSKGDFPVAERCSKEVLSLPVHPSLTNKDIAKIIKVVKKNAN